MSDRGWGRVLALARHEVRILVSDPLPIVLLFAFPLAVIAFFKPALELALFSEGYVRATGAEQAVPGVAVTFSLFLVGFVGLSFFREHGWGTWDRLLVSPTSTAGVLVGKLVPIAGVAMVQLAFLFSLGVGVFGLRVRGSAVALAVVCVSLATCSVSLGMAVVAGARTLQQVNIVANLGTVVLAGLGGALVPVSLLPGWTGAVAPAVPPYWAMRGFRAVILDGGGLSAVALPAAVLVGFTGAFVALAMARFRATERKVSWA